MKKTIYQLAEEIISLSKGDCTPLTMAGIEGLALEITNIIDKEKSGGRCPEYSREIYKAYEKEKKIWICTKCQGEPCLFIAREIESKKTCLDFLWHQATPEEIEMVKEMLKRSTTMKDLSPEFRQVLVDEGHNLTVNKNNCENKENC